MKKLTKSIAIIFVLTLTLSMVPAVNTNAASKKTRNKVVYELKDGTLTISGKGKMPDSMRFKNNKKIKKVVIKKGVTYISKYAFSGCKNLKKVKIAKTVKEIGWHSFENTKIEKITIPSSVKTIGNDAFSNCHKLTTIIMPGHFKVKIKGGDEESYGIMSGVSIETINFNSKFKLATAMYCRGSEWNVWKKDPKYKSIDGVIYTKDGKNIVRVPSGLKELTLADSCETFNLQSILYGSHILEDEIEGWCMALEKITIPETVKRIEDKKYKYGYSASYLEKLNEIVINAKRLDADSIMALVTNMSCVTGMDDNNKIKIESIAEQLPGRIKLESDCYILDDKILLKCAGKEKIVTVPEGVKIIAAKAFVDESFVVTINAEKVILPEGLEEIGEKAFYGSERITEIKLPDSLKKIGTKAFAWSGIEKIEIPSNITDWGVQIFAGARLKEAILPDNMIKIPDGLFDEAIVLSEVNVPSNLTRIGDRAFAGTNVDITKILESKTLKTIGDYAFEGARWTELVIPASIEKIGGSAFSFSSMEEFIKRKVTIEGNETAIASNAFSSDWEIDSNPLTLTFKTDIKNYFADLYVGELKLNKKKTVKRVEIRWTKVEDVDGYDIRVSSNKKFKKNVKKINAKKNKTAKAIKVKMNVKKVYVKIRPYKMINGKKVCGKWTKSSSYNF